MIEFGDDYAFLERELKIDWDGLGSDRSLKQVANFERSLDTLVKQKFPNVSSKTERFKLGGGYVLSQPEIQTYSQKKQIDTEVRKLTEIPNLVWKSVNSFSLLAPNKVPPSVVKEINDRRISIKNISRQIQAIKSSKEESDFTKEEINNLKNLLSLLRKESTNFTKGLDPKMLAIAQATYNSTLFKEKSLDGYDAFLTPLESAFMDLKKSGTGMFNFFSTGNGLPSVVNTILQGSNRLFDSILKKRAQDIRSGKYSGQFFAKSSKNVLAKEFNANKDFNSVSQVSTSIIHSMGKIVGPYGFLLMVLAKAAQYIIAGRQQQISFNQSIINLFGTINQLSMVDPKAPNKEAALSSFYQTLYDYLNDKSFSYTITRPDGSVVNQDSFSIQLNLDPEKYISLLDPLIKSGLTIRDLEAEFGRVNLKPNMIANIRTGQIANLKGPLEDYYAISQVFQSDPSELGRAIGDWRFSFGDLFSTTTDSFRNLANIVSSSPVSPKAFLANVISLSDSFSYFTNRSRQFGTILNSLVRKRALSADQGRDLLSNVLQEVMGYSTSQIMGVLGPLFSENPRAVSKFLTKAASTLREQIKEESRKAKFVINKADKDAALAKVTELQYMLDYATRQRKLVGSDRSNLTQISSFATNLIRMFPDLSFDLLDDAVAARYRVIYNERMGDRPPSLSKRTLIEEATTTLGLGSSISELITAKRYTSKYKGRPSPPQLTAENIQQLVMKSALSMNLKTITVAESLDKSLRFIGSKIHSTFMQLYSVGQTLWNFITNAKKVPAPALESTGTSPSLTSISPGQVVDYRGKVPAYKLGKSNKGEIQRLRKIVLHSTEGTASSAISEFTGGPGKTSAHYIVGRDGKIYYMVDEKKIASHGGAIGPGSSLLSEGFKMGESINPAALGIEIERYGKSDYTEVQYMAVARLVSSLMTRYGLSLEDVISHEEVARGRERVVLPSGKRLGEVRTDPVGFDWSRLRSLVRTMKTGVESAKAPEGNKRAAVRAYQNTIQEDTYSQRLFEKAYATETAINTNMSYGDFVKKSENFLERYDLPQLKRIIQSNGKERTALILNFFRDFKIEVNPEVILDVVRGQIRRVESKEQYLKQMAHRQKLKEQVKQFSLIAKRLQHSQRESIRHESVVGLDESFREKFAQHLSQLSDGKSILIEQYNMDVYIKDSSKFIDYIMMNYRPTVEKGVSSG